MTAPIEQLDMFGAAVFVGAPAGEDYDAMTDMAFQPATCAECGAPNRRNGAYILCTRNENHWRMIEACGRPEHPRYEEFVRYRRAIGHPVEE
jgi:hypothetical protein